MGLGVRVEIDSGVESEAKMVGTSESAEIRYWERVERVGGRMVFT